MLIHCDQQGFSSSSSVSGPRWVQIAPGHNLHGYHGNGKRPWEWRDCLMKASIQGKCFCPHSVSTFQDLVQPQVSKNTMLRHGSQKENQKKYLVTILRDNNTLHCWRTLRKILLFFIGSMYPSRILNLEALPTEKLVYLFSTLLECTSFCSGKPLGFVPNLGLRGQGGLLNKIAELYILSQGTIQNMDAETGL